MDARQGGIIVAHSDPARILQPVTGKNEAAQRALAGERGTMETRSSSGELDLTAFAPVPGLTWSVLLLEPAEINQEGRLFEHLSGRHGSLFSGSSRRRIAD